MAIKVRKEILGSHVHLAVFVGPDEDHLALAGRLVMRIEESGEVEEALLSAPTALELENETKH